MEKSSAVFNAYSSIETPAISEPIKYLSDAFDMSGKLLQAMVWDLSSSKYIKVSGGAIGCEGISSDWFLRHRMQSR
jgi:hypothetical protein